MQHLKNAMQQTGFALSRENLLEILKGIFSNARRYCIKLRPLCQSGDAGAGGQRASGGREI
jgi:hypothetical protein